MTLFVRCVVLLGIGHTNAHILKEWARNPVMDCRLICISRFPTATYSGMLPGTLAGQFSPDEMQIDLKQLAERAGATLMLADITSVDWTNRVLLFENAESLKFDILSIGVGSMPAGLPESNAACLVPIKPMQTFLQRLDERINVAAAKPGQTLKVAVVGGGVASIEIALCLHAKLLAHFRQINFRIRILTSADEIADELRESSVRKIRKILDAREIEVQIRSRVTEVHDSGITINETDHESADVVIWSTGAAAPPVLSRLGLPVDEGGFLVTKETLQSTADSLVFAVGDSGSIAGIPFPKAGVYAVRQSPVLWHNIQALLNGGPLREFTPQSDFLKLLNTGDGRALMLYKSLAVHARWCWTLKTWIDRRFLRQFSDLSSKTSGWLKLIALMLVVAVAIISGLFLRDDLSLSKLAAREAAFRTFQVDHPALVYVTAFAAYVVVAGLSLPGATALTLLIAWLLGFWRGMLVVSFGSTAGATVAFLLSRYFLRTAITKKFGDRLIAFNDALRREGAFYLFTLRLIPAVPFFVINAVMGLTPLAVRKFWWVSQIGMLPGTAVYVYAGASVPKLQVLADKGIGAVFTPSQLTQILIAFALLGLFPLIIRLLMKRLSSRVNPTVTSTSEK